MVCWPGQGAPRELSSYVHALLLSLTIIVCVLCALCVCTYVEMNILRKHWMDCGEEGVQGACKGHLSVVASLWLAKGCILCEVGKDCQ